MRLIIGPPGSGKTTFCLDRLREALRANENGCCLLVPTATMAEHLRNQLAREGFVFRPGVVSTLSKFVELFAPSHPTIAAGTLQLTVENVLRRNSPEAYLQVRDFPGFRTALAAAIDEFTAAGGRLNDIPGNVADFAQVFADVEQSMRTRGLVFRDHRWHAAAEQVRTTGLGDIRSVWLAGFFSFTAPELDFVRALSERADTTACLPRWSGSEDAIVLLRGDAVQVQDFENANARIDRVLAIAPTLDAEIAGIAQRILQEHQEGRPFREMAVAVRTEEPYVSALRSAFRRFGIPSRFYFGTRLSAHPVVRYFFYILDALLSNWNHENTLVALRASGSPLESDDRFDYTTRTRLPGAGLEVLGQRAPSEHEQYFSNLAKLNAWVAAPALPQVWQKRFRNLVTLYRPRAIRDKVDHEQASLDRSDAAALRAWETAVDETMLSLDETPITCQQFREALRTVLTANSLRPPDHRRDVVHIIDAFEGRQWRVPLIFICGLIEKQFPKHHSENPILADSVRLELRRAGINLRTSIERQEDENFLFDVLLSRATERAVLSYPVLNAKAEANMTSVLLERAQPYATEHTPDIRLRPERARSGEPYPSIYAEDLRTQLAAKHRSIRATSIETYLQCPYQFFAQTTLRLIDTPIAPTERLDVRAQGNIAHDVLERVYRERAPLTDVFDDVFHGYCRRVGIPDGYRTEAVRLDLLHNLELFVSDDRLLCGIDTALEQNIELPLDELTTIKCRIDRIEVDGASNATVIDYKYKGKLGIDRTKKGHEEKVHVQGGLYLLALEHGGKYRPAGMVYCGFKREVSFGGWILKPYHLTLNQECDEESLREVMRLARELTVNAAAEIRDGRILPSPADEDRCDFCSYSAICRVEKTATPATVEVGQ